MSDKTEYINLPTMEVSEDCISREWLKEHIEVVSYENEWREIETDEFVSWENIESAPSVVPTTEQSSEVVERKRGEWTNAGMLTVHCSNCKSEFHELEAMNFCPNCGADMRGAK